MATVSVFMTETSYQGEVRIKDSHWRGFTWKSQWHNAPSGLFFFFFPPAEAEAVLDCIEQSQTVVLVPTSTDTYFEFGMLSAIHAALVERQTRLVFIKTEARGGSASGSLPEALQLLSKAGHYVIWKGMRSMSPSSPFWKQLRYYLPAPQHAPKMMLLPQTSLDITS